MPLSCSNKRPRSDKKSFFSHERSVIYCETFHLPCRHGLYNLSRTITQITTKKVWSPQRECLFSQQQPEKTSALRRDTRHAINLNHPEFLPCFSAEPTTVKGISLDKITGRAIYDCVHFTQKVNCSSDQIQQLGQRQVI